MYKTRKKDQALKYSSKKPKGRYAQADGNDCGELKKTAECCLHRLLQAKHEC